MGRRGSRKIRGIKRRRPPPYVRESLSLPGVHSCSRKRCRFELIVMCWPGSQGFSATAEGACPPYTSCMGVFPVTLIIGRDAAGFRKNREPFGPPGTPARTSFAEKRRRPDADALLSRAQTNDAEDDGPS